MNDILKELKEWELDELVLLRAIVLMRIKSLKMVVE
jgi:hypothetical protein